MVEQPSTDPLGRFMNRLRHPVGYPHSGIPFSERFPNLTDMPLARTREDFNGYTEELAEKVQYLADDCGDAFGVPRHNPPDWTVDDLHGELTGGSHSDKRRAIDDLKDHLIESIGHDAETVRALGRSIDARLAALEALEAMTKEVAEVEHGD